MGSKVRNDYKDFFESWKAIINGYICESSYDTIYREFDPGSG